MISKLLFSSAPFKVELNISNSKLVSKLESITSKDHNGGIASANRVSDWLSDMNSIYIGTVKHGSFDIRRPLRNAKIFFYYPDIKGKIIRQKGKVIVQGIVTNSNKQQKQILVFMPIIMSFLAFCIIQFTSGKGRPILLASLIMLPYYFCLYIYNIIKCKHSIQSEKLKFIQLLKRLEKS